MTGGHYISVDGKARSCIYDLNAGKLYSINHLLAEKLHDICDKGQFDISVDEELAKLIDKFISLGILEKSSCNQTHDISELKETDTHIGMVWVEITSKCNLRCIHCYNESDSQSLGEMSLNDYKLVIDNVEKLHTPRLQIIGGEPFVNKPLLKEMLKYTVGKFEKIEIFTNGTLITDDWYEFLKKNNIYIALSVYSYVEDQHDNVTGNKGSWYKTNTTIKKLHDYGINYRICNILMKNIALGERNTDLYELSSEKDVVRMTGRANFRLLTDELIEKKLITKNTFSAPITKAYVRRLISGHNCYGSKLYISSSLEVFPCVMERRFKHCSIDRDAPIKLDENILRMNKDKVNDCAECEYRYACFDCRPNSLSGSVTEKPWYCTYNPQKGIWDEKEQFIQNLRKAWE